MKYCEKCGAEMDDNAEFCPKCGAKVGGSDHPVDHECGCCNGECECHHYNKTLRIVASIFMLITVLGCLFFFLIAIIAFGDPKYGADAEKLSKAAAIIYLIPLLWQVPMTIVAFKSVKDGRHLGIAYKVCTLIFVSVIGGILLLCDVDHE
jgi:hypothetical protein